MAFSIQICVGICILFMLEGTIAISTRLNSKIEKLKFAQVDQSLRSYYPKLSEVTQAGIERCFESIDDPNSTRSVLFFSNSTIRDLIAEYFDFFSNLDVSNEKVNRLLENTESIIDHVVECSQLLTSSPEEVPTHKVGYTLMSSADIRQFLGYNPLLSLKSLANGSLTKKGGDEAFGNCDEISGNKTFPESFNWCDKYKELKTVGNQGSCGSCWAFSLTGVLEAANLKSNKKPWGPLAPQFLVDFAKGGCAGCSGGFGEAGATFLKKEGLPLESTYPYAGRRTTRKRVPTVSKAKSYCFYKGKVPEDLRIHYLTKFGPQWFVMKARGIGNYKGGIYKGTGCGGNDSWHAILLVGYTKDAWIVRNSWSETWGDKGFIRIARKINACSCDNETGYVEV